MVEHTFIVLILNLFVLVQSGYPPTGDEVLPGSVLLPASRRGRYLANIVRRQAVDGTGIKFNKDADRMNAEAKKKVDVLSDELLPYIIAEQERRTTLYKRIMTAIQNGEKGVTIAEIRNKPPLIIRKGLMYRCPANRAPKEPDGSGNIKCEEDIEPSQVMYDSCLSAEDKDLYETENKVYFFCNRHKIEGPDLPRNGSAVIGCAPKERTSLNYTTGKCALEDTNDVVVHYRYYPDRSYKFVMELDPDHEVCDHWNPCQIGYIFSLPNAGDAQPANELWRGYSDELIPQDSMEEFVHPNSPDYQSSPRHVRIPEGYEFEKLWAKRTIDNYGWNPEHKLKATVTNDGQFVTVGLKFPETWSDVFYSTYYAVVTKKSSRRKSEKGAKSIKFLVIALGATMVTPQVIQVTNGEANQSLVPYKCPHCHLMGMMVRTPEGRVHNIDPARYRLRDLERKTYLDVDLSAVPPNEYGDYFAIVQNADGVEERVKILSMQIPEKDTEIKLTRETVPLALGAQFMKTITFDCEDCNITDVICNGESAVSAGRAHPAPKIINLNINNFEDSFACVYTGIFTKDESIFRKIVAVVENDLVKSEVKVIAPPAKGAQFEQTVPYTCEGEECSVQRVSVNGIELKPGGGATRRAGAGASVGSIAFYVLSGNNIVIRITEFSDLWEGVYQAVFNVNGENVTKTILEIGAGGGGGGGGGDGGGGADSGGGDKPTDAPADSSAQPTDPAAGGDATTAAGDPSAPEAPAEGGEPKPEAEDAAKAPERRAAKTQTKKP